MRVLRLLAIITLHLLAVPGILFGQSVTRIDSGGLSLAERFTKGRATAGEAWVGYAVPRLIQGERNHDRRDEGRSLAEVLGEKSPVGATDPSSRQDLALLFRWRGSRLEEVIIADMYRPVALGGRTLIWLGTAGVRESIEVIENLYRAGGTEKVRENLVVAAALHADGEATTPFLAGVLQGDESERLRGSAAFWLGSGQAPGAVAILARAARTDASLHVRDQAVFGLSLVKTEAAVEELIELVHDEDNPARKQALFWLSQRATDRSVEAIGEAALEGEDAEVQEQAVFALTQLPDNGGLEKLIEVAETHGNPKVRRSAIFWLGRNGSPHAVEVLERLARGGRVR